MKYSYPHVIENSTGEKIIFHAIEKHPDGDRLVGENFVRPGDGPPMHTHFLQDEGFTVVNGRIGYEVLGQPAQFAGPGDSLVFKRGIPHRFWNAGEDVLHCKVWAQPAHTFEFFITSIFAAQVKSGKPEPEKFDAAFLLTRYSSEYEMVGIPKPVRKIIMPIIYQIGKLFGKYKHFENAPAPVRA